MIVYSLQTGSVFEEAIKYQPRSCFILTQLGDKLSPQLKAIRKKLKAELTARNIAEIDAHSLVTGRDFLDKIWRQILSVPIGIAILCKDMKITTVANIFYELFTSIFHLAFLCRYPRQYSQIQTYVFLQSLPRPRILPIL